MSSFLTEFSSLFIMETYWGGSDAICDNTEMEMSCWWNLVNGHYNNFPLQWRHNGRDDVWSPALRLFTESFIQAQIKENIKAPRHWPLFGEFTGDKGPVTRKMFPFDDVIMRSLQWPRFWQNYDIVVSVIAWDV